MTLEVTLFLICHGFLSRPHLLQIKIVSLQEIYDKMTNYHCSLTDKSLLVHVSTNVIFIRFDFHSIEPTIFFPFKHMLLIFNYSNVCLTRSERIGDDEAFVYSKTNFARILMKRTLSIKYSNLFNGMFDI